MKILINYPNNTNVLNLNLYFFSRNIFHIIFTGLILNCDLNIYDISIIILLILFCFRNNRQLYTT